MKRAHIHAVIALFLCAFITMCSTSSAITDDATHLTNEEDQAAMSAQSQRLFRLALEEPNTSEATLPVAEDEPVDVRNSVMQTPLIVATSNGNTNAINIFLDKGANPNAQDRRGQTALHFAAMQNNVPAADALIERGADVNLLNHAGDTPLSLAIAKGSVETAETLVDKGAHETDNTVQLTINTEMHTTLIRRIDTSRDGRLFLTASEDGTTRLWETETGALIHVFRSYKGKRGYGKKYACALSPEGTLAATGGRTAGTNREIGAIYLYNTITKEMAGCIEGEGASVLDIAFSPDGRHIAVAYAGAQGVMIYDAATYRRIAHLADPKASCYNIAFDGKGRLAVASLDGSVYLYSARYTLECDKKMDAKPYALSFSPDGKLLAVGFLDTPKVIIYDGRTLRPRHEPDITGMADEKDAKLALAWSQDGTRLYAGGIYDRYVDGKQVLRNIRAWSGKGKGDYVDYPVSGNTINDIRALPDDSLLLASGHPDIRRITKEGRTVFYLAPSTFDFDKQDRAHLSVSEGGTRVSFTPEYEAPITFDLGKRRLYNTNMKENVARVTSEHITLSNWRDSEHPSINGNALSFKRRYERTISATILHDDARVILGTDFSLYLVDANGAPLWMEDMPGPVWSVAVDEEAGVVVALCQDGTVRWHRLDNGKRVLSLFVSKDKKRWVVWTENGYYDTSVGGESLIGWHINNARNRKASFYTAGRFRDTHYRPRVVAKTLFYKDEKEALTAVPQAKSIAGISATTGAEEKHDERENRAFQAAYEKGLYSASVRAFRPPTLSILQPRFGIRVREANVTVRFLIDMPNGEPPKRVQVVVNGQTQKEVVDRFIPDRNGNVFAEATVTLRKGDNAVIATAENSMGWSDPAFLRIHCDAQTEQRVGTNLVILSIGISRYQNEVLSLNYAAKDAKDFSESMIAQEGVLYAKVLARTLLDEEVSREEIIHGLTWLLSATKEKNTIAMIFFSGHGSTTNGTFFFLPYDVEIDRVKETGLSVREITDTVRWIRSKVIIFMDACHSGGIPLAADTTLAANELRDAQNGVAIICSSTANQTSVEDALWENGAFTEALLEGLTGEADLMRKGVITVKGLDYYISERVKELTGYEQEPVSDFTPAMKNFVIAVRRDG